MTELCMCVFNSQTGHQRTTDGLLVWFASAGCSAVTVESFPAPGWKCILPSVAEWQPLGGKWTELSLKKVHHKSKKRLILTHRWGTFRDPPCWASPHHCVGWAFSVIGTQHWCSAYADAHCCWQSLCEFASLGPGLFLESKECWPDWRAIHKRTQSVRWAKMIQEIENLIKKQDCELLNK